MSAERLFLGLRFADLPPAAVAARIAARPAEAPFAYLATPNADHLVRLRSQPGLRVGYEAAALLCLDSRVVAGLARLVGLAPPQVATGADIVECLLTRHLAPGDRMTIIGLAEQALPRLLARLPNGVAIAHHAPPQGLARNAEACAAAIAFAQAHPARFTFLAVGSPVQERLATILAEQGGANGFGLCIGAALEFMAGTQPRAPQLMRRLGLEWLHRLVREPRRLAGRYLLRDPAILPILLAARFRRS